METFLPVRCATVLLMEDRGRAVSRPALATLRPFNLAVEEIFASIK
jgi:hypothetical protein